MNSFVAQAMAIMVIVREKANFSSKIGGTIKSKDYSLIDIGIASENICLQARAEGLGSCMIGWFDEEGVRKILSIPQKKRVHTLRDPQLCRTPDRTKLLDGLWPKLLPPPSGPTQEAKKKPARKKTQAKKATRKTRPRRNKKEKKATQESGLTRKLRADS